jgi:predicted CxxxxCH...CXXCH cytochrome family protein
VLLCFPACGSLRQEPPAAPYTLHGARFADPANPEYHGAILRGTAFDMKGCQSCHGADFLGGEVGVSCATCHPGGPTACTTCHGAPPQSGAHLAHVPKVSCDTCHAVPPQWDAPGHIDPDGYAEVALAGLARAAGATPSYQAPTCAGTYCHGATLRAGTKTAPAWNEGPSATQCGTCHAVPPPNHYGADCAACHGAVIDNDLRIVNPTLHVDGTIDVVDLSRGCSSCHGPPQDLGGAHTAHLGGRSVGRAVACTECHVVPAEIGSPGHLDAVAGAEITFGPLARAGRSTPAWDGARCSGSYCHGATLRGGSNRTPAWGGGASEVACGSCHGVPLPNHFGERCADCHGAVVDRGGRIIRPDLHVNGTVDLGAAP